MKGSMETYLLYLSFKEGGNLGKCGNLKNAHLFRDVMFCSYCMVPAECFSKSLQMKIFDSIQVKLKSIILLLFSLIVESSVTIIVYIFANGSESLF